MQSAQAGTPAFESLRALAARKLPEVEALIERAEAMRAWLRTATDCSCTSLDACALFDPDGELDAADRLRVMHVGGRAGTA
jgi:hypothetical protein